MRLLQDCGKKYGKIVQFNCRYGFKQTTVAVAHVSDIFAVGKKSRCDQFVMP